MFASAQTFYFSKQHMDSLPSIEPFEKKLQDLDAQVADPHFYQDQRKAAEVLKEHQRLSQLVQLYKSLEKCKQQLADNKELLHNSTDPELKELAKEDSLALEEAQKDLHQRLLLAMIPPDPLDSRNTVMEIRAGAGGDEASLFAANLYRMYCRFAESKGWKVESLSLSSSECGGFKEVAFLIKGEDVYRNLKLESGVHRVQRVPNTEANGRIHTSTATVAVLPEAEEVDVKISPEDLEITVSRASGPGGQGVNTTDSAVQILHKPTGLMVNCADERSQQKNRVKAMTVLRSRLLKLKEDEERAKYAATRKNQVGSGDRSERIRTYNYPQGRLTDHRIGLTLYSLENILEGNLQEMVQSLLTADQGMKLANVMGIEVETPKADKNLDD